MRRTSILVTLVASCLLPLQSPRAQGLKQRREIAATKKTIAKTIGFANRDCGAKFQYEIKWKTFLGKRKGGYGLTTAAAFCGAVFRGLGYVCSADAMGKKAVKGAIKKVVCRWDANATQKKLKRRGPVLKLDKKAKVLHAGYQWETKNVYNESRKWLEKNL